jgi:hypothetical protein
LSSFDCLPVVSNFRAPNAASVRMSFYNEHIYPHLVSSLGDPNPIREIRQKMIPLARGTVLEIGVGPRVNFAHYDPQR